MRKISIIRSVLFAMLLGLISPVASTNVARATDPIVETVHVRDHLGVALPGAIVYFGFGTAGPATWQFTDPVTADSSGTATVALPSEYVTSDRLAIFVLPPEGNNIDAIFTARGNNIKVSNNGQAWNLVTTSTNPGGQLFLDTTQSEDIRVQLQMSSVVLHPTASDGTTALPGPLWVNYTMPVWPGGVLTLSSSYTSYIYKSRDLGIYIDTHTAQSDFDALASPTQSGSNISVWPANQSNQSTVFKPSNFKVITRHGSPNLFTLTQLDPDTSLPLTSQQIADSSTVTAGSDPSHSAVPYIYGYKTLNQQIVNNVKLKVIDPNTSAPISNNLGFVQVDSGTVADRTANWFDQWNIANDGSSNGFLSDGTYTFIVNPPQDGSTPNIARTFYTAVVTGGAVQVYPGTSATGTPLTANSSGVLTLSYSIPNISGHLFSPGTTTPVSLSLSQNSQWVDVCLQQFINGGWQEFNESCTSYHSGYWGMRINDPGQYRIYFRPTGISGATTTYTQTFTIATSGSSTTIAYNGGTASSSVTQDITLASPNAKFFVGDPKNATQALGRINSDNGGIQTFYLDSNGNQGNWIGYTPIDSSGNAFSHLDQGSYLIQVVAPYGSDTLTASSYVVTVAANGTIAMKTGANGAGPTVVADGSGVFHLAYGLATIKGEIHDGAGHKFSLSGNQYFCVNLQKRDAQGNFQWVNGQSVCNGSSTFAISATESGVYRLQIDPHNVADVTTTFSSLFTVVNTSGSITIAIGSDAASGTLPVTSNVTLDSPNVKLVVKYPNSSHVLNLLPFGYISFDKYINGNRSGYIGSGLDPNTPGSITAKLPDGSYIITVNPQNMNGITGLAQKSYTLTVSGSTLHLYTGIGTTGSEVTAGGDGTYEIQAAYANITGTLVDGNSTPITSGQNQWVSVCDQSSPDGLNWNWNSCTNTDSAGSFALSVTTPGTHRIALMPNGYTAIATTYTFNFNVANDGTLTKASDSSSFSGAFGNITASTPSIKVKVTAGSEVAKFAGVEIRFNNQFVEWDNTGNSGVATVNLSSPGSYQFFVHPGSSGNFTTKEYDVTAVKNSSNQIVATANGITADSDGAFTLPLGTASLSGTVFAPDGTTPVPFAQVVARDLASNQDLWQYSAQTFQDGTWSMSLPAGTYSMRAQPQGGSSAYGSSAAIGSVKIDNSGSPTLSGTASSMTATHFNLTLQAPYWAGVINDPTTPAKPDSNAHVCFNPDFTQPTWTCANTDSSGQWAMSKPDGFTGTYGANAQLQIAPNQSSNYSMVTLTGSAISSVMSGAGATNLVLTLGTPNVNLTVKAGSTPVSNAWVNVGPINGGQWLGFGSTGLDGVAHLNIPLASMSAGVKVYVDVTGNPAVAKDYGQTNVTFTAADVTSHTTGSIFAADVPLAQPNLRGHVTDPTLSDAPAANTNVDLFDSTSQQWVNNSFINQSGDFTMNIATGSYTMTIRAPQSSVSTAANHSYSVTVASDGVVTITDPANSNATISKTGNVYPLTLLAPSIIGKVTDPTGTTGQANSWVSVFNNGQIGGSSNGQGQFSLAVADGTYQINAQIPWGSSTYAPSGICRVTVSGSKVTSVSGSGTSCSLVSGVVIIPLKSPNLTVTLLDSSGAPIQYGNVNVDLANLHSNAQTDANGVAKLNVDVAAAFANAGGIPLTGNIGMHIGFHPQWNTTSSVPVDCSSGPTACPVESGGWVIPTFSSTDTFASKEITIKLPSPNTKVTVTQPDGSTAIGANAWVQIFKYDPTNHRIIDYVGGSGTDLSGNAVFNISDLSAKYAVMVYPPWGSSTYSPATLTNGDAGFTGSDLNNHKFALGTPNLKVISKDKNGSINTGGWVMEEYTDSSGNPTEWIGGQGFDFNGSVSLNLPDTSTSNAQRSMIRLTFNPGPGNPGAVTTCYVGVASGEVSLVSGKCGSATLDMGTKTLTDQLLAGNVSGHVTSGGVAVAGAIVQAQLKTGGTATTSIVTSTDASGNYSLQLDSGVAWTITIIPVAVPGAAPLSQATKDVTFVSGSSTVDFVLGS